MSSSVKALPRTPLGKRKLASDDGNDSDYRPSASVPPAPKKFKVKKTLPSDPAEKSGSETEDDELTVVVDLPPVAQKTPSGDANLVCDFLDDVEKLKQPTQNFSVSLQSATLSKDHRKFLESRGVEYDYNDGYKLSVDFCELARMVQLGLQPMVLSVPEGFSRLTAGSGAGDKGMSM
jgi:hypothetical protein